MAAIVSGGATAKRTVLWYVTLLAPANLAWEAGHLRLYTLWDTGSFGESAYAVLHCTIGDVMIALASLGLSALTLRAWHWPSRRFVAVLVTATVIGVAYTMFSEWWNVEWRGAWAYAAAMPRLPFLGTGVTPVLQWALLPPLCLMGARRLARRTSDLGAMS